MMTFEAAGWEGGIGRRRPALARAAKRQHDKAHLPYFDFAERGPDKGHRSYG